MWLVFGMLCLKVFFSKLNWYTNQEKDVSPFNEVNLIVHLYYGVQ